MASRKIRRRLSNRDLEFLENVMFSAALQAVWFDMLKNRLRDYEDRQIAINGMAESYRLRNQAKQLMIQLRDECED